MCGDTPTGRRGEGIGAGACRAPAPVLSFAPSTGAGRTPPCSSPSRRPSTPSPSCSPATTASSSAGPSPTTPPSCAPPPGSRSSASPPPTPSTTTRSTPSSSPTSARPSCAAAPWSSPFSRECWLHLTVATLLHDVGYLRGVCPGDGDGRYVVDAAGNTVAAPRGATDAFLAPWHVERGQIYVRRRCAAVAGARRRAAVPGDRADPVPGAGGPGPRGDGDRGRAGAGGRPDRAARRPGLPAQAGGALLRVPRDRGGGAARLPRPGRPGGAVPALLLGQGGAATSGRRCATWSGRRRVGCGWRSCTRTCSWRSTCGTGSGRSGAWARAGSCGWSRAGRSRRARSRAGGRPGPSAAEA